MILTYVEYTNRGYSDVQANGFDYYSKKAERFLAYYTAKKIYKAPWVTYEDDIKETLAMLVDMYAQQKRALTSLYEGVERSHSGVASESVMDHSISYTVVTDEMVDETERLYKRKLARVVREMLWHTGMLYRGI